jgi:hypothetical protein
MSTLFNQLTEKLYAQLEPRFHEYEVRNSLLQIALRWNKILSEPEKAKIARSLGGNRYAKTTRALLDELFNGIVEEHMRENK